MSDESKVIPLHGRKSSKEKAEAPTEAEADEATVKSLEYLAQQAREGKLKGIAFVTLDTEGDIMTAWTTHSLIQMAGAVATLHHRYMTDLMDDST